LQVDAFADAVFGGNPAAVVPLERWLPDDVLQAIAGENNLSETAFVVRSDQAGIDYAIRWMTPRAEVDLCGHATLGAAHALWTHLGFDGDSLTLSSRSGPLRVSRVSAGYELDFPALPLEPMAFDDAVASALGERPTEMLAGMDLVAVYPSEADVRSIAPNLNAVAAVEGFRSVAVTAPGDSCDFVSRLFAPALGIKEDPVTGSLHCMLAPLWAGRLGTTSLDARQLSPRGGRIGCVIDGDRVRLTGSAVTYLDGTIAVPESLS
ncbi:MAG: PhzF family phenazine biosynthesis protein, partial [Planctomycetota bacterium]